MPGLQTEAQRKKRAAKGEDTRPKITQTVEYLDEDWTVEIAVPGWAKHKAVGGEPSPAYEDEGGDSMWELYVKEMGEKAAKREFEKRAAKQAAQEKAKNDKRLASLKKSFEYFDDDNSGFLTADEVLEILMRMTPDGTPLTEDDAKEFIKEFDRDEDGTLNVDEFIVAMGVISDAYDADGDGVADMKQGGGEYDGKEDEFAAKLVEGETMLVAGLDGSGDLAYDGDTRSDITRAIDEARKLQS